MNGSITTSHEGESRSSDATSRSLIVRVRADERDAWNRLVVLYAPLVEHWCRRRRLNDADAADVFQEVFQAVARHIADFRRGPGGTFRGWLRTITERKIIDFFRRRSREAPAVGGSEALERWHELPDPATSPEIESQSGSMATEPQETALERRLFQKGLELIRDEFEPRTWQAFWLTTVDGRSAAEAGAELSMSPGAVRVAKSRVLQRLRAELGDVDG